MSTDKQTTAIPVADRPVKDLSVAEFLEVLEVFFHGNMRKGQERYVTSLKLHEFAAMMVDLQSTKQYVEAAKESETAFRVFGDIDHLQAATTPFRVKSMEDIARLKTDLEAALSSVKGGELAVAVAVVKP